VTTPTTDYIVGFSAGSAAVMYIFERTYRIIREARNGHSKRHAFADDPERYWESMRSNVTTPLSVILDKQTEIIEKQVEGNNAVLLKLATLDERTRYIRSEDRTPYYGPERRSGK
jgi:hypothetical protein